MSNENDINSLSDIPESYQRYIDEIYSIASKKRGGWVSNKEIAENLEVEPASVSGMLEKLKENNLIKWEPRKAIRLTEKGRQIALTLNEIHVLLHDFFKQILKMEDEVEIEYLSCQIEHHISREVKESLQKFMDSYLEQT
ncbi:MAG: hypothetical protein GF317_12835 [Candidatus Lokiarchaeota archaeon]|nr:hypothetical protein [Candidatus Lokiarchaeota archaeon]MBD3200527.1 hypothetical protein [Candidatus Lokiarchaeota archaeon]